MKIQKMKMINLLLSDWNSCIQVTQEFLDLIPDSFYHKKPFGNRFRSCSWEFACILSTREMYLAGFQAGILGKDTPCRQEKDLKKLSKNDMTNQLEKMNNKIKKICRLQNAKKKVLFFGEERSIRDVVYWLMQHEQLHFGKLMIYLAKLGKEQPKSLKQMWGQNSFPNKKTRKKDSHLSK